MLFVTGKGLSFFRRYETQNEVLLSQQAGQTPDGDHFVVMILSISQDIWATIRWVVGWRCVFGLLRYLDRPLKEVLQEATSPIP